MKKRILIFTVAAASVIGIAQARSFTFWVFGTGSAQEDDRQAAISEATDAATDQVNAACIGTVVRVERTGASCFGGGDNPFNCLVFVKGACEVQGR